MNALKKILYLIPILILATCVNSAWSQSAERDRVQTALNWTDRIIEQAQEAVKNSRSLKARVTLKKAVQLQERARNRANDFSSNASRMAALNFTRAAREEAKHAIALARTETRLVEKARRLFERTKEKLNLLNSGVAESGIKDMRVEKFMMDARVLLEKAHMNYSQMNNRSALKLAEKAQKLTEQANRRFRRLNKLKNSCTRRLNILKRLAVRTGRIVERNGDQQSQKQLATAQKQLEKARNFLADGRYNACNASVTQSEKLMRGLMRRINSSGERGLESALDRAWYRLERAGESPDIPEGKKKLLNQAEQMLIKAEENYQNGRIETARKLIENALQIIQNAEKKELSKEYLRREYEKLSARDEMIRELVRRCGTEESRTLYQRAKTHMNRARELTEAGKLKSAYSEIMLTRNIFNRISEIC